MAKKKTTQTPQKTTAKSTKKPTTKRGRGRQPGKKKVIGVEELEKIARMYVEGSSHRQIATALGVDHTTIQYHLDKSLRPMWRVELTTILEDDLARVADLEAKSHRVFAESGEIADLSLAKWAIEHRAKLAGHFAAQKHTVSVEEETRVAGKSPAEYARETLNMLVDRAGALKASEEAAAITTKPGRNGK